jgi:hypothetical protein
MMSSLEILPPLNQRQVEYLKAFAQTPRFKRDVKRAKKVQGLRRMVKLPIGKDAEFFVLSPETGDSDFVVDAQSPPGQQPSLCCHWSPSSDGQFLHWTEKIDTKKDEQLRDAWLQYITENFMKRWNKSLSISGSIIPPKIPPKRKRTIESAEENNNGPSDDSGGAETGRKKLRFDVSYLRKMQEESVDSADAALERVEELVKNNVDLKYIRIKLDVDEKLRNVDGKFLVRELHQRWFTCKYYPKDHYIAITNTWASVTRSRNQKFKFVNVEYS